MILREPPYAVSSGEKIWKERWFEDTRIDRVVLDFMRQNSSNSDSTSLRRLGALKRTPTWATGRDIATLFELARRNQAPTWKFVRTQTLFLYLSRSGKGGGCHHS